MLNEDVAAKTEEDICDSVSYEEMLGIFLVDSHNNVVYSYTDKAMKEHLKDDLIQKSSDSYFASSSGFSDDSQFTKSNESFEDKDTRRINTSSYDISYRLLPLIMLYRVKSEYEHDPICSITTSHTLSIKFRQLQADFLVILMERDTRNSWISEHMLDEFVGILQLCFGPLIFDSNKYNNSIHFPPEVNQQTQLNQCSLLLSEVGQSINPSRLVVDEDCSPLPACVEMNTVLQMQDRDSHNAMCNSFIKSLEMYFETVQLSALVIEHKFIAISRNGFGRKRYKHEWLSSLQKLHRLKSKVSPCGYVTSKCIYHFQIWLSWHNSWSLYDYFMIQLDALNYLTFLCEAQFNEHLNDCASAMQKLGDDMDSNNSHILQPTIANLTNIASANADLLIHINQLEVLINVNCMNSQLHSSLGKIMSILQSTSLLTARTYRTELVAKAWNYKDLPLLHPKEIPPLSVTVELGLDISGYLIVYPEKRIQISESRGTGLNTDMLRIGLEYCNLDVNGGNTVHPRFMQLSVDSVDYLYVLISVGDWVHKVNIFKRSKWIIKRMSTPDLDTDASPIWALAAFEPFINHSLAVRQARQLLKYFMHKINVTL